MLVRESPKARVSPSKNAANWPPKSPYEALLSSPSGRKKWQERQDRISDRSPSPSPIRKPLLSSKALQAMTVPDGREDEEEDDEETLQLQLQAIEAKLKLKKLQQAKSRNDGSIAFVDTTRSARKRQDSIDAASPRKRPRLEPSIEVPVSPTRDRNPPQLHTSPARILLGIDKGLRAQDVSLKRPRLGVLASSSSHTPAPKAKSFSERLAESRSTDQDRQAKEERIEKARSRGFGLNSATALAEATTPRGAAKFQLLASARSGAADARSTPGASVIASVSRSRPAPPVRTESASSRISFAPLQPTPSTPSADVSRTLALDRSATRHNQSFSETRDDAQPSTNTTDDSSFESCSSLHLSRRHMPHTTLSRHLADKQVYTLPRLLKEVKAPHYLAPDCESDFVVLGIIASKSTPYNTKPTHHKHSSTDTTGDDESSTHGPRNKFMVMKLVDLHWEVDVFLFDSAFSAFWKLTPGTVVAILNPTIMPPKPSARDTGRFSLKLTSSEEAILEIGVARDLGFCKARRKDAQLCATWVNARKTEFCDYHVNLQVDKARAGRMEVNGMFRSVANSASSTSRDGGSNAYKHGPRSRLRAPDPGNGNTFKSRDVHGRQRDADTGESYYAVSAAHAAGAAGIGSVAQIMDAEELGPRTERLRKRLAEKERETELARKLGALGNGIGAEYLRADVGAKRTAEDGDGKRVSLRKSDPVMAGAEARAGRGARGRGGELDGDQVPEKLDAAALGLVGNKDTVRLGPVKGRKRAFQASATSSTRGAEAMGWGGAGKRGLLEPAPMKPALSPEKGQTRLNMRAESPKKRARFALDKGIREPGRESLGDVRLDDYDDDELDIV